MNDTFDSTQSLAIVDLQALHKVHALNEVAGQIQRALQTHGFMYVRNHGIDGLLIENLRQTQRVFFSQSLEQKRQININGYNRGYLGQGEARMHGAQKHDQKEVFFWGAELADDHPHRLAGLALCGPNQWPEQPASFKQTVLDYTGAIAHLGERLLQAIALALNLPQTFFAPYYDTPMTRGQLIHYPPTQGEHDDFGVAPHTDFGCITLLLQETAGLEVQMRDGSWIAAPPIDNTLVINIGDLIERWTDGRLPSTRHRVRNLTGEARYSIAIFHDPAADARIDPNDMRSNSNNFEPVAAADYIQGRNKGAFAHFGQVKKQ